jgi:hypothetical protein
MSADVSWTWDMLKSGSEPPGAKVWYRWHVTDKSGAEKVSDTQNVVWLDNVHNWDSITEGQVTVHWYKGDRVFAKGLLDRANAVTSLGWWGEAQFPINIYVYGDYDDLRNAVLYEPGWLGGQAYPTYDIVIVGVRPEQAGWDVSLEAHELTHVLTGHLSFSCLSSIPTWLNEGMAVYAEGMLNPQSRTRLLQAISDNTLISLEALSGGFSEKEDRADLSYAESYGVVSYMIGAFGRQKLQQLLMEVHNGSKFDDAMRTVYGFDVDQLEDKWRENAGAPPRPTGSKAAATAAPTPVPTYRPIAYGRGYTTGVNSPDMAPPTVATPAQTHQETQPDSSNLLPFASLIVVLGVVSAIAWSKVRR